MCGGSDTFCNRFVVLAFLTGRVLKEISSAVTYTARIKVFLKKVPVEFLFHQTDFLSCVQKGSFRFSPKHFNYLSK